MQVLIIFSWTVISQTAAEFYCILVVKVSVFLKVTIMEDVSGAHYCCLFLCLH